jgi:four helix bundle protein
MRNFREYDVWIDAMEVVENVYKVTDGFPSDERFSLTSQITRSAVSIPSNIAEGASRTSEKDFARFLEYSLGSSFELETQLRIASRRKYIGHLEFETLLKNVISLQKRIFALRKKVLNG